MFKKLFLILMISMVVPARAEIHVQTVDFLQHAGVEVNAAGPLLVQADPAHDRIVVANTLSSSISIIDGETHAVVNIPLGGRALQHLKSEAMTLSRRTGDVYLIGTKCFYIVSPESRSAITVPTDVQFGSIAVHEKTGNVFVTSRESKRMGFYQAKSRKLTMRDWLDHEEKMINLNQTPPPPIRKVISDNELGKIIAVDGFTSTLYVFDAKTGKPRDSRSVRLASGGRWHLAGYNEKTHCLYLVTETARRKVIEAAKINVVTGEDVVVSLPEFTEGVGINYNPVRDEVYVPYDNHPSVHVVDFDDGGAVEEIKLPAYGNDAGVIDLENDLLYVASWAFGEVDVVDLTTRELQKRITGLGIIPHMFSMTFNPNSNLIYFPKGATAVNGTFGAAVSVLDPAAERCEKIRTGWAPVDLIGLKNRNGFLVFNSEDQFAEVSPNGRYEMHDLPYDYPVEAIHSPSGDVYLSYGPHQSYWPTVYIWGAKNGVLTIDKDNLSFYDRRIPRQAHKMVLDKEGVLYFTQNNWGSEVQFLGTLEDEVRVFQAQKRIALGDTVSREITQRILEYDRELRRIYLVRVGEGDQDVSVFQAIAPDSQKVLAAVELGVTSSDLVFDDEDIYVANFESNSVTIIDKNDFTTRKIRTGEGPIKLCRRHDGVFVLNHLGNSIQAVKENGKPFKLPREGTPNNLFSWNEKIAITSHNDEALFIILFDPADASFTLLHEESYPYGDTSFDTRNVSFYVNGQFGDAVFSITQARTDSDNRLWVTDFLSGKLFIIEDR